MANMALKLRGVFNKKRASDDNAEKKVMLLKEDSPFAVQEAYKTIRTNLQFALSPSKNKCVVVSSALPGEGKSTTCANLALTMSQTGAKVLLIDADLRKSSIHKLFSIPNKMGLSSILGGFCEVGKGIHSGIFPNLDVMTAGPTPPNPSELLGSANMEQLIAALRKAYDYIFIDSPPINVVTDALVVAKYTAGIVLIARQGQTTHEELRHTVTSIEFTSQKILGMVLNGTSEAAGGYYKYRKSYKDYKEYR